ncbi:hypothetical protein I552_2281 [Mycobacterium xenopi 3993]|nr:hypothetical protein I552_2281 [Mycobacterium xenopi 3993]
MAFAAVDDMDRLQRICDQLGEDQIDALLRKRLPSCRTRIAPRTAPPVTATSCQSCRPSSP